MFVYVSDFGWHIAAGVEFLHFPASRLAHVMMPSAANQSVDFRALITTACPLIGHNWLGNTWVLM
jgi:hypothetical protein